MKRLQEELAQATAERDDANLALAELRTEVQLIRTARADPVYVARQAHRLKHLAAWVTVASPVLTGLAAWHLTNAPFIGLYAAMLTLILMRAGAESRRVRHTEWSCAIEERALRIRSRDRAAESLLEQRHEQELAYADIVKVTTRRRFLREDVELQTRSGETVVLPDVANAEALSEWLRKQAAKR